MRLLNLFANFTLEVGWHQIFTTLELLVLSDTADYELVVSVGYTKVTIMKWGNMVRLEDLI
jgi:hypothetical protein